MRENKLVFDVLRRSRFCLHSLFCVFILLMVAGCFPCGIFVDEKTFRGRIVDADTGQGIGTAVVSTKTLTDGEQTGFGSTLTAFGEQPPDVNGQFELRITSDETTSSCLQRPSPPTLLPPDQLEITVTRDNCEQMITIGISEDTVVDITFPNDLIELKDPILVPACEP